MGREVTRVFRTSMPHARAYYFYLHSNDAAYRGEMQSVCLQNTAHKTKPAL